MSRATPQSSEAVLIASSRARSRSGIPDETASRSWTCALVLLSFWRYRVSTFVMTLVMLWLLGSVSSVTMGGFLHILLVVAIGLMLQRVIYGRKVVGY